MNDYEFTPEGKELFNFAGELATWLHRDQKDKSGVDYIRHPQRVAFTLWTQAQPAEVCAAGYLHDVTEDTSADSGTLWSLGFPTETIEIVNLLDRNRSKMRWESAVYWSERGGNPLTENSAAEFYYARIKEHPGALAVKLADIADNTLEWRLEKLDAKTQDRLRAKYARALELLS